jgi:glutamine amidotransferase
VITSQVHRSLLAADNALAVQSRRHPDGWGVAYYLADAPHVIKNADRALEDQIFRRVSGVVASETVVAHLRKATAGAVNILNCHPFQFGRWVFAHNGKVHRFDEVSDKLRAEVAPNFRRYILGDTDSEVLFYLFLTHLAQLTDVHRRGAEAELVVQALCDAVCCARSVADDDCDEERSLLTFVVTDGNTMVGFRSGEPLLYSTYKHRCLDRDSCPHLSPECEAPTRSGFVNHLLVSSEPLQGDNEWTALEEDTFVSVDWRMALRLGSVAAGKIAIAAGSQQPPVR